MAIFSSLVYHDKIFENGSYFFNYVGLHFRPWTERFILGKEDFTATPISISVNSLPHEFWHPKILEGIGNSLESFVKISELK
jgi:hypothetical protein